MALQPGKFWNEKREALSADALFELHKDKFLKQLKYVFDSSPFYRKKFREKSLALSDIKGLEEISKLPFAEKKELREAQSNQMTLCLSQSAHLPARSRFGEGREVAEKDLFKAGAGATSVAL